MDKIFAKRASGTIGENFLLAKVSGYTVCVGQYSITIVGNFQRDDTSWSPPPLPK